MLVDRFHGSFDLQDKVIHLLTPFLVVVFSDPFQFTEKMRIAECMTAWVPEMRCPEVVNHRTLEPWQDLQVIHRQGPSFTVVAIREISQAPYIQSLQRKRETFPNNFF
jgi:hypothetical protein